MPRSKIASCLLGLALLALGSCGPTDYVSSLYVAQTTGSPSDVIFFPQGHSWRPGSHLEIKIWGEPQFADGQLSSRYEWRSLGTVTVDGDGMFGFNSYAFSFVIRRSICGSPPQQPRDLLNPTVQARDVDTGLVRMFTVPNHYWFTFHDCA